MRRLPSPGFRSPKALPKVAKPPTGYKANLDAEDILTLRQVKDRSGMWSQSSVLESAAPAAAATKSQEPDSF
jgi:hypothetical protein